MTLKNAIYRSISVPYVAVFFGLLLFLTSIKHVVAEPYLAQRYGQKCMACHTNITGGGKRTTAGIGFTMAMTDSPVTTSFSPSISEQISLGANFRGDYTYVAFDSPDSNDQGITGDEIEDTSSFNINTGNLYLDFALSDKITFYLDQEVAPEGGRTREAIAIYKGVFGDNDYLKAGRFFLPFGLRLQDDTEFIREVTGFNFDNSDTGIEYGIEHNELSFRIAASNGTQGAGETNKDKQVSSVLSWVKPNYRLGISGSINRGTNNSERNAYGLFAGLTLGKWVFLAEVDKIDDIDGDNSPSSIISFVEANYLVRPSTNIKLSYGFHDADDDIDENERTRFSLLGETFLNQFSQLRYGVRRSDGIPQNTLQNQTMVFTEYHVFF